MSKMRARKGYVQDSSDARIVLFGSGDEPTNGNEERACTRGGGRGQTRDGRGADTGDTVVDAGRVPVQATDDVVTDAGADADRYHRQHKVYHLLGWWYSRCGRHGEGMLTVRGCRH